MGILPSAMFGFFQAIYLIFTAKNNVTSVATQEDLGKSINILQSILNVALTPPVSKYGEYNSVSHNVVKIIQDTYTLARGSTGSGSTRLSSGSSLALLTGRSWGSLNSWGTLEDRTWIDVMM